MADGTLTLKALINKEENKVIFVESGSDFVDILFSFLTMPVGEMVRLIRRLSLSKLKIGCMNNLHQSVQTLDLNLFRSQMCQTMLLHPKNGAPFLCNGLKWNIVFRESMTYYGYHTCGGRKELLSYYNGTCSRCHCYLNKLVLYGSRGEAFLDRMTRFLVSDALDVVTATSAASFSLVSKVQMQDLSLTEERTFKFGKKEVLELFYYSLVSKKPLTETFLQQEMTPQSNKRDVVQGICIKNDLQDRGALEGKPAICIKLFVSKSRGTVCYAEASNEFIDLLFSFLTVPLGYAQKISGSGASLGSLGRLCKSVQNCLKSTDHKEIFLNPKIPKYFGYKNQLLGIEEVNYQFLHKSYSEVIVDTTSSTSSTDQTNLALVDPKPVIGSEGTGEGFLIGHVMFTVTDDLIITPISPISSLSMLNKMNVPCSDVEELIVFVGEKGASRLLLAALTSQSVLTEVFLSEGSKNESILKEPKKEF